MKATFQAFTRRRSARRGMTALVLFALMGLLAACLPAGAEQVPYRMDASNQAGWWKPIDEFGFKISGAWDPPVLVQAVLRRVQTALVSGESG